MQIFSNILRNVVEKRCFVAKTMEMVVLLVIVSTLKKFGGTSTCAETDCDPLRKSLVFESRLNWVRLCFMLLYDDACMCAEMLGEHEI